MDRSLIVINPNSSQRVTDGIDRAVDPLRTLGLPIRCETLAEGPPGIEDQRQADLVVAPLLDLAARLEPEAAGFVIACFGDPGLQALRLQPRLPVFGIQESAVLMALTKGHRFGVLSILPASIPRHLRAFAAMGLGARVAGDRALGLGVAELADRQRTAARMVDVAATLRDTDGAEVLILGCAGMADYRADLERACGLPVIDPCQAAVALAVGQICLRKAQEGQP